MKHGNLIIVALFISVTTFAQSKQFVGIGINPEIRSNSVPSLGFGLQYENQISKHHGFEINLNYRSYRLDYLYTDPLLGAVDLTFKVRENYLSVPVSYKLYTSIVNFSAGLTFDYFVNADNLSETTNIEMSSYKLDPRIFIGCLFKVGKSFQLSNKLAIEPELYYNPVFSYGYSYYGASVKLKYKLLK